MERWRKYWSSQTSKRRIIFAAFMVFSLLLNQIFGSSLAAWLNTLPVHTHANIMVLGLLGWLGAAIGLGYYLSMRFYDDA